MTVKIYNEDCLEGMKRIPDGSVDFVLTDLPYAITDCAFDKCVDLTKFWEQIKRVTKHNAAVALFSMLPFAVDLINANRKMFRYEWIWYKNYPVGFLNAKKMPLRCHENILIFYRKLPTYNPQKIKNPKGNRIQHCVIKTANYHKGGTLEFEFNGAELYPRDVQMFRHTRTLPRSERNFHPQQKPTDLLEYLIRTYTNEGETVLDATMGSGSTGVACINTGRRFIGFELDEHYYKIAAERLKV